MKFTFTLALLCCILATSFAQPICGFDHVHQTRLAIDPQYANQVQLNEQKIRKFITESKSRSVQGFGTLSTAIIPVVVHVIHTGGAVGTIYNPSDADIQGAIDYLNKVYAADASVTSGSVGLGIQFVLAKRTPYCSATTGIDRVDGSSIPNYVANGVNADNTTGTNEINVKNLSRWDPSSYYNIWVVNKIDGKDGTSGQFIAGYAYFAGAPASLDGTIMLATQMKTGQKTLPHEMGHAFSLYHPFQGSPDKNTCPPNTDCNSDGDMVCDTDPITYNQLNGVVNFTPRTGNNTCAGKPYTANTESNFMNYTTSYLLFTAGQSTRVSAALSSSRASLANSLGSLSIDMAPACVSQINFEIGSSSVTEATTGVDGCRGYKDYTYHMLSSGPQPSQSVIATLTTGGSAVRGLDYDITTNGSFTSPSLDIPFSTAGDETKSFTVRIYDDKAVELQKTISVAFTLSNTSVSIGNVNPTLTITLVDDDAAPVAYFSGSINVAGTPTTPQGSLISCFSGDLNRHRVQYLYRKSDLNNAGILSAAVITALKLQVTNKKSTKPYTGFTISMGQVPATTTTLGNFVSTTGFTTVYSADYTTVLGTNNIPFSTNFNWDGQSNIVINICFDNSTTHSNFDQISFNPDFGTGQYVAVLSDGTGASSGCSLPAAYVFSSNPAITFDCSFGAPVESVISSDMEYLGANAQVYFKDASGKLLAAIQNLTSFDYGCTKVEIDRAGTGANTFWHTANDKKVTTTTFKVTPTNANPAGQYKITLYYTKAEIDGWKSVTSKNLPDVDMRVVKVSNHNISEVTPTTPYVADVQWAPFTKAAFGSDTAITATFSTGFSGFGVGAIDVTPLPVTWLSFTGKRQNEDVLLNWSTSTELNNNYFDVETSADGANFYKVGQVKSKGDATLAQQYSFTHYLPVTGINYYRLKQVDIDGEFTYSNVISVVFDSDKGQTIGIYPSPATNELNVTFSKNQENVMLRVVTIDGKVVETKEVGSVSGKTSLNVSSLTNGIYILQVRVNNEWRHFKFIKQ